MSTFNALNTAVYSALSGNANLTTALGGTAIYYQQAPDNTAPPYVTFRYITGNPENDHGNDVRNEVLLIMAWTASPAQGGTIDNHCGTTLHRKQLTVSGYTVFWQVRETEITVLDNEPNKDKLYGHGAYYRVRMTPT